MSEHDQTGELTLAAAVRRYFDVALYLLIFTAFGTLASTGRLDLPTVFLVTTALLFRGYILARQRQVLLSERTTNLLTIACVAFYVADEFVISKAFLGALVHLVLFVMLVRLFSAQRDRDHYMLAVLSFVMVLAAAVLTVDSTFLLALAGFVLVGVATFVLMEMLHSAQHSQVQGRDPAVHHAYRKLSFAIAGIAPVLLLCIFAVGAAIFFVLPRVSAGYMSAYTGGNDLSSGFSDRVELGKIGEIQQSKTVVMHIQITGDTAGSYQLKWRGVALDRFDGRNWTNTNAHTKFGVSRAADGKFNIQLRNFPVAGHMIHYRVTMEPLLSDVFFLASRPVYLQGNYRSLAEDSEEDVFDIDSEHPVTRYEADSVLPLPRKRTNDIRQNYPSGIFTNYLQLPQLDPRIEALARKITDPISDPLDKASAIENYLRMHYGYTLKLPGQMPRDPVSNFLFVRREGHCEYFASSMAVMLRSIGIPSRIVNGFSGGEFNDLSSQYVIRASDAHSWVEAYFPGQGWVEFDPTPPANVQASSHWARFLLYLDAAGSFWREWIINYDIGHQLRLTQDASRGSREIVSHAQSWLMARYDLALSWARSTQAQIGSSAVKWTLRVGAAVLLVLLIASVPRLVNLVTTMRLARRPEKAPQIAASIWYQKMLRQVARHGWEKRPSQTPEEFASAIGNDELKQHVENFTEHYENARFGKSAEQASRLSEIYEEIKHSR